MVKAINGTLIAMLILTGSILVGCSDSDGGSSSAPTITRVTPAGDVLNKSVVIVVFFSESMDTASLVLGGDLASEGNAVWSSTTTTNDTVTISPRTRWTSGQDRSLTVNAKNVAGNSLRPFSTAFLVPMEFTNFQAAELVIGQPDFVSSEWGLAADRLSAPYGNVAAVDGALFNGDFGNNRVLGFNAIPQVNGAAAHFVLSQPDFLTDDARTARDGMDGPQQVSIEGDTMAVADYRNDRVLIYNSVPANGSALPDFVVGQQNFTTVFNQCDSVHMDHPETVVIADGRLVVTDSGHNRVLIWNSIPASNGPAPDLVLGQADLTSCAANDYDQDSTPDAAPNEYVMAHPSGVWSDGDRLIVADFQNSRVLLWNTFPTTDFQPADIVLGQKDFTLNAENDSDGDGLTDSPNANTMSKPYDGVWSNGLQIFVADTNNHRILIWNSWPTSNFEPADIVIGQSDFIHHAYNDTNQDGTNEIDPNAAVLHSPAGVFGYEDTLFVSDEENGRILVFRSN